MFSPSSLAWTNKQGFVTDVKLKKHLQILICFNDINLWICMSLRGTQGYSLGTNNRKHYRKSNNVTWFMCQFLSRCLALFNKVKQEVKYSIAIHVWVKIVGNDYVSLEAMPGRWTVLLVNLKKCKFIINTTIKNAKFWDSLRCIGPHLNTAWSYITKQRCSACQSQIPTDDQCSRLIGLFTRSNFSALPQNSRE